ncbi:hypothetical protein evm_003806 [Chilo suppressalis]|nr:hypothetical protein evm_003806 [Chilo suppressalis]
MTLLARDDVGPVEADRGELAKRLLPTFFHTADAMLKEKKTDENSTDDPLLRRVVCVLLDMVRQLSDEQYSIVVKALEAENAGGSRSLLSDALHLMTTLLQRPVFKLHWADILHLQHYVMLHALRLLSTTLRDRLSNVDESDTETITVIHSMWRDWFTAVASLATSSVLQLDTLPPGRKQRVLALYGDLRRSAASLLGEMCCHHHHHHQPINVPTAGAQAFSMDGIGRLGHDPPREPSAGWKAALRSATPHRMHLTTRVLHFYEQVERPHMYIRYVHKLANMHLSAQQWAEAGLSLRLHAKLLKWAAIPLPPRLRHPAPDAQDRHSTHRELKENLYLEIAELLNRGRQWELAVDIVKELVSVYEEEALGYGPLAELHGQLASLYGCMLRTPRCHPGYFRVMYYGEGFPEHLRVPHGFVYRGNEYEQLQDFKERLLDEWPDADVLPKLDPPGEEITQSDGQYLQINAVEPVISDKLKRLSGKPVADQILMYYKHNNVDKFVFSRPFHRPEESLNGSTDDLSSQNEFATRWLERTELEISDKLPGILRWFPVVSQRTFWVSPVEAAVEALRESNRALKALILSARAADAPLQPLTMRLNGILRWFPVVSQRTFWVSPVEAAVEALRESNRALKALILSARAADAPLQPLTMRLNGILDPAVQGGIVNYERAFLTPSYEARHPEHAELLQQLKDLIADQIPLLKFGLDVHGGRVPNGMEALHAHLLACFRRVQHHVHQRYGRKSRQIEK